MEKVVYKIDRTIRCKNAAVPGTLGKLAFAIGKLGVDIGNISTVHLGHHYTVRDIQVFLDNVAQLPNLTTEISKIPGVTVLEVRDEVLNFHKNGKIKMVNTVPIKSVNILRKVYTPGVAEVCQLIAANQDLKDTYTSIPYSVAIVTDGTAILGLGDIGPVAGMPVMEGKAALLQQLVGISGIPVLLNTRDPEEIIRTIEHIAPTFGGIQLEDIASPRCFPILDRLEKSLKVPVMHDDQQGTATVVLAALINACKIAKINIQQPTIGLLGLGAAGLIIGKFILKYTGKPALGTAKTEASIKRHKEAGGIPSNLDEIMAKADIVIGTSGVKGLIDPKKVRKGQIIFALTNPYPEIDPEAARASGAILAADGRTINNLLGFPGLWRGTLDALAKEINFDMYKAASLAIAAVTPEGELVPDPLEPEVHLEVTHAVARAAVKSGVARRVLDDGYYENANVQTPPWI